MTKFLRLRDSTAGAANGRELLVATDGIVVITPGDNGQGSKIYLRDDLLYVMEDLESIILRLSEENLIIRVTY